MNNNTMQEEIDELNRSIDGWAKECERLYKCTLSLEDYLREEHNYQEEQQIIIDNLKEENKILKEINQELRDIIGGNEHYTEALKDILKRFNND